MKSNVHPQTAHRYVRVAVRGRSSVGNFMWRCVKPGCQHYLREDFIVGAISECNRCGNEFTIDKTTALKKPHCRKCTRRRNIITEELQPIPESPI